MYFYIILKRIYHPYSIFLMILSIQNLSKTYANGVKALDNVSLDIPQGMLGLLGPNGAGKSSLMRTIATLQEADHGTIHLDELNVLKQKDEMRRQLGYLPQEFGVYPKITAKEMLTHLAVLKGIKSNIGDMVDALLQQVNLYENRKKYVSEYSGGMRQRFGIAQALIGDPNVLIVDEPTAGLDPGERNRFHNILSGISENKIVILSTHIVQDVIELCQNMAIIHRGQLKYHGAPNDALHMLKDKVYEAAVSKNELEVFRNDHSVLSEKLIGGETHFNVYADQDPGGKFVKKQADLEDVFFHLCAQA